MCGNRVAFISHVSFAATSCLVYKWCCMMATRRESWDKQSDNNIFARINDKFCLQHVMRCTSYNIQTPWKQCDSIKQEPPVIISFHIYFLWNSHTHRHAKRFAEDGENPSRFAVRLNQNWKCTQRLDYGCMPFPTFLWWNDFILQVVIGSIKKINEKKARECCFEAGATCVSYAGNR